MTAPMNICVLGGSGFVGSALVARLAHEGHWVTVPTRNAAHGDSLRVLPTVRLVRANVHDAGTLDRLVAQMDAVINLVGILNEHGHTTFSRVHVELVEKLITALRAGRVRRVLHMSAMGADVHGPSRYLRSKGEAEARIHAAADSLDFSIFRPSVIFGPGDSLTNRFAGLLRLTHGLMPLARSRTRFSPVFVGDVAAAFVHALRARETCGQTYELGGPEVMTLEDIVRVTAEVAGLPCHIVPLADALGWIQAAVLGCLPGKPLTLDNFRSLGIDSIESDSGCARLGISPRGMMQILPTYLGPHSVPFRFNAFL